jgi:hypothetical protein
VSTQTETTDADTTERFRFEVNALWTEDGREWHLLVPFTGDHAQFEWGVKNTAVSARTHTEPTETSPRIVELRGSLSQLTSALTEYSNRAIRTGDYSLGDLFQHGVW